MSCKIIPEVPLAPPTAGGLWRLWCIQTRPGTTEQHIPFHPNNRLHLHRLPGGLRHCHIDTAKANEKWNSSLCLSAPSLRLMLHTWPTPRPKICSTNYQPDTETPLACVLHRYTLIERCVFSSSWSRKRWGPAVFAVPEMHSPRKSPTWDKQTSSPWYISYSFAFAWLCWMLPRFTLCAMLINSCSGWIRPLHPPFEREPTLIWMTHLQCKTRSISNPAWRVQANHPLTQNIKTCFLKWRAVVVFYV